MSQHSVISLLGNQPVLQVTTKQSSREGFGYVVSPQANLFSFSESQFTIEVWCSAHQSGSILDFQSGTAGNFSSEMNISIGKGGRIEFTVGGKYYETRQTTNLLDGNWHQLRLIHNTSTDTSHTVLSVYVDNILQEHIEITSFSPLTGVTQLMVNGSINPQRELRNQQFYSPSNIVLADLRLWKVARPFETAHQDMYIQLPTSEWSDKNLVGYWIFEKATSGVRAIMDYSSYNSKTTLGEYTILRNAEVKQPISEYAFYCEEASLQSSQTPFGASISAINAYDFGTSDFSFSSVFQTTSGAVLLERMHYQENKPWAGFSLQVNNLGQLVLLLASGGTLTQCISEAQSNALDGQWHQIAAIRAQNNITVCFDGFPVLKETQNLQDISITNNQIPLNICGVSSTHQPTSTTLVAPPIGEPSLDVAISQLRLYNIALSIDDLYREISLTTLPDNSTDDTLVGYWNFATGSFVDRSNSLNMNVVLAGDIRETAFSLPSGQIRHKQAYGMNTQSATDRSGVSIGVIPEYDIATEFSIETWFKFANGAQGTIFSNSNPNDWPAICCYFNGSTHQMVFSFSIERGRFAFPIPMPLSLGNDHWYHLAITKSDDQVLNIYLNGKLFLTQKFPYQLALAFLTNRDITLGYSDTTLSAPPGQGNPFPPMVPAGLVTLSEFRIWGECRSQQDIQETLYRSLYGNENHLLGYWNFDQYAPIDLTSNDNSGALLGTADIDVLTTLYLNPPRSELYFASGNAYLDVGNGVGVAAGGAFTIEAWVKLDDTKTATIIALSTPTENGLFFGIQEGQIIFLGNDTSNKTVQLKSATGLEAGIWYHLSVTSQGNNGQLSLYINAVLNATLPNYNIGLPQAINGYIGATVQGSNISNPLSGAMLSMRFWTVCRSQAELSADLFLKLTGTETGLLAYWYFLEAQTYGQTFEPHGPVLHNDVGFRLTDFDYEKFDTTLRFIAADKQYMNAGSCPNIDFTQNFTIELWVRVREDVAVQPFLTYCTSDQKNLFFLSAVHDADAQYKVQAFLSGMMESPLIAPNAITLYEWTHLALTYDANHKTLTLYVNGKQVNQATYSAESHITGGELVAGANLISTPQYFDGSLHEIRIWNTARQSAEITLSMHQRVVGSDSDIWGYWPCTSEIAVDPNATPYQTDLSNYHNHFKLLGGVSPAISDLVLGPPVPKIQAQAQLIQNFTESDAADKVVLGSSAYQTVIRILNPDGSPIARQVKFRIWTRDSGLVSDPQDSGNSGTVNTPTQITVDGATYAVGASQSIEVTSNLKGVITVSVPTRVDNDQTNPSDTISLSCNPLKIWADFMLEEDRIIIEPDANLRRNLTQITPAYLQNQDGSGGDLRPNHEPLIPKKSDTHPDADQVAQVLAESIISAATTVKDPTPSAQSKYAYQGRTQAEKLSGMYQNPDVQSQMWDVSADGPFARSLTPDANWKNFQLDYSQKTPTYQNLSDEEVSSYHKTLKLKEAITYEALMYSPDSWISNARSIWNDFIGGVASFTKLTMSKIKGGLQLVIEVGTETLNIVISSAKQVGQAIFGFTSSILQKYLGIDLKAAISSILNFFKNLFDWDDILITQQVFAGLFNKLPPLLHQVIDTAKTQSLTYLQTLSSQISSSINEAIDAIGADSLDDLTQGLNPSDSLLATQTQLSSFDVESNWFIDKVKQNQPSSDIVFSADNQISAIVDTLENMLNNLSTHYSNNTAVSDVLSDAITYCKNIYDNPLSMGQFLLKAILQLLAGIAELCFATAEIVMESLFKVMDMMVNLLFDSMNQRVNCPVITWLYESVIAPGQSLTPLNVGSLILAIPATLFYKALNGGVAPFSDSDLMQAQTQSLQSFMTRGSSSSNDSTPTYYAKPYKFTACYGAYQFVFFFLDTAADTVNILNASAPRWFVALDIVISMLGNIFSYPSGIPFDDPDKSDKLPTYGDDLAIWYLKFVPVLGNACIFLSSYLNEENPIRRGLLRTRFPIVDFLLVGLPQALLALQVFSMENRTKGVASWDKKTKLLINFSEGVSLALKGLYWTVKRGLNPSHFNGVPSPEEFEAQLTVSLLLNGVVLGVGFSSTVIRLHNLKGAITSLALEPVVLSGIVGQTGSFRANAQIENLGEQEIAKACDWISNNTSIITVDGQGNYHLVGSGNAVVSANYKGFASSNNISVEVNSENVSSIAVTAHTPSDVEVTTVNAGDTVLFSAQATVDSGNVVDISEAATWSSSGTAQMTFDFITQAGNAQFTAHQNGSVNAIAQFEQKQGQGPITVANDEPVSIVITSDEYGQNIFPGKGSTLTANALYKSGLSAPLAGATWTSSDETIATVNNGTVLCATPPKTGGILITAVKDNLSATAYIWASEDAPTGLILSPAIVSPLAVGQSIAIKTLLTHNSGDTTPTVSGYTSNNPSVASIDAATGEVKALAEGVTVITGTYILAHQNFAATLSIDVVPKIIESIRIDQTVSHVAINKVLQLESEAVYSDDSTEPLSPSTFLSWTSSNDAIARVSPAGAVVGVSVGNVVITANYYNRIGATCTAQIVVTVT